MNNDPDWTKNLIRLSKDSFFHREMAQIRTKALLKEVAGEVPTFKWTYVPSRIVRNMTAAVFSLEAMAEIDPKNLKPVEGLTLLIARTWESLANLREKTSFETALMNAAVAYELAGYQANAACLSRKLGLDFTQITKPSVNKLTSAFMQRLFLQTLILAKRAREEPQVENFADDELLQAIGLAIAGEGFDYASRLFLSGDMEALSLAKKSLKESERVFASGGYVVMANLIRSVRNLLPVMWQRATWTFFVGTVENNRRWLRYLKLLARGTGVDILRSPSISELWPSQIQALESGLLSSNASKVIRMPTSSGKTRIAELAMVHTLVTISGAKCVYVAPYRALVWELEQTFLNLFGDLGFQVSSLIGSYESDDFQNLLAAEADILVLTPEKLDLLQRAQPEFLDNVRLFVLDEGQIVHDKSRGVKFELLLTRLKRRLPNARFLLLSAVIPRETLEDFVRWFNASPDRDIVTSDWRPSNQRFAKLEWQGQTGTIRYSPDEDNKLLREFVPGVIRQQTIRYLNPKTGRTKTKRFPDTNNKAQIAAELAFKFAELGPVLIFCSQPNFVRAVAKALQLRLELSRIQGEKIPSYFLTTSSTRSAMFAKEWLGDNHPTTVFLNNGIAIHHGNLPDALRKSIEGDFRNGQFQILAATNTLAQGVNLPIRTVIVHSCGRYNEENRKWERIPARDYWNIAGRAGRAGRETEGTIIHIVRKRSDEKDYEYYLENREEAEPVNSALYQILQDLMSERLSEDVLGETLDPEILALLVEEGSAFFSEGNLERILEGTLVQVQSIRGGVETGRLQEAFREISDGIIERVPNITYQGIYSSTGLSSESCEKLRSYINENQEKISDLLRNAGPLELNEMAELFLNGCLSISEMTPRRDIGGSYGELLGLWLSGVSIPEIVSEFGEQTTSVEELANFIDDLFEYRLPWGFSGLIQIAIKECNLKTEDLSEYSKYFPTMVKYGVPTPEASWALSAGIPFRQTAVKMATRYVIEKDSPNREDFIQWLAKLDSEDLHHKFGLESPTLEDVSRVLSRSGPNPLLRQYASTEEILPYDTYIVGIAYENRFVVASRARVGQCVDLVRDYDNRADRNAVKAQLNGQTVGYLERQLAQLVAPDIDCGLSLKGEIIEIEEARVPQLKIRMTRAGQ